MIGRCHFIHACICHILTSTFISDSFMQIHSKNLQNVYSCENMSVKIFGLILKSNMATIADCLKIIDLQVAMSHWSPYHVFKGGGGGL